MIFPSEATTHCSHDVMRMGNIQRGYEDMTQVQEMSFSICTKTQKRIKEMSLKMRQNNKNGT